MGLLPVTVIVRFGVKLVGEQLTTVRLYLNLQPYYSEEQRFWLSLNQRSQQKMAI